MLTADLDAAVSAVAKAHPRVLVDPELCAHGLHVVSIGLGPACVRVIAGGGRHEAIEIAASMIPRDAFAVVDDAFLRDAREELETITGQPASDDDVWDYATQDLYYTDSGFLPLFEIQARPVDGVRELLAIFGLA